MPGESSIIIYRYTDEHWNKDVIPEMLEQSVGLSINGKTWLSFLCLPEDIINLAIGFLFTEKVINNYDEIISAHLCKENTLVDIWLTHAARRPHKWIRTSGCGGGVTRGMKVDSERIFRPALPVSPEMIFSAMQQLYSWQSATQSVRGIHCSALFDCSKMIFSARDVGRHNTLDKLAGMLLKESASPRFLMTMTTGRITSEMLTKCARMGTAVVVSRTSPSQMAARMAEAAGITLIGHVQSKAFNVFAHPEIIEGYAEIQSQFQEMDLPEASPPPG